MAADASKYECLHIRPTNGRADDQLRRNHSTQYFSFQDHEWNWLRQEKPEKYESYEVSSGKARLNVHGASQPVLVVNDLKLGDSTGGVALWVGVGTEAHVTNLRLRE